MESIYLFERVLFSSHEIGQIVHEPAEGVARVDRRLLHRGQELETHTEVRALRAGDFRAALPGFLQPAQPSASFVFNARPPKRRTQGSRIFFDQW